MTFNVEHISRKIRDISAIFKNTALGEQLPIVRKFAKSGHPAEL
jgi:hypothetical protein